jgi:hypothetical protein
MNLIRVQSINTMTLIYHMYRDKHMEKFKKVMRQIKLISINRNLFWMPLEVYEVVQVAVHVLYDA